MIQDLSRTLKAILTQPGTPAPLANAQIVFDRPLEQFKPTQTTIDIFLYDIRENVELRNNEPELTRQNNGRATLRPPPLRVTCSYLITAWPGGPPGDDLFLQEHQLLGQVLQVLGGYAYLTPEDKFSNNAFILQGQLRSQQYPVPVIAAHADTLRNLGEFWTALGNQLRPSVTVTATIGLDVLATQANIPLAASHELQMKLASADEIQQRRFVLGEQPDSSFLIGGRVVDNSTPPKAISQATVSLLEVNLTTQTDRRGRYSFGQILAGNYTLRAQFNDQSQQTAILVPNPSSNVYRTLQRNYNLQLNVQLPD